jgi:hypothetical protein
MEHALAIFRSWGFLLVQFFLLAWWFHRWLGRSGLPACQACGYAIRALQRPACPECAARLDMPESVRLPIEPRQFRLAIGVWGMFVGMSSMNAALTVNRLYGTGPVAVWLLGAALFLAGAGYMVWRWRAVRPEPWDVNGEEPMWLDRTDRCLVRRGRTYEAGSPRERA